MIVVAIIGILAAFAIPAYQDYISKTQVTRVVGELAAAKTGVDAALFNGKTPILGSDVADETKEGIGLATGTQEDTASGDAVRSNLISNLTIEKFKDANPTDGSIEATLGNKANKDIHGVLVSQNRSSDGVWTCAVLAGNAKGFKNKFIPTGCKNQK